MSQRDGGECRISVCKVFATRGGYPGSEQYLVLATLTSALAERRHLAMVDPQAGGISSTTTSMTSLRDELSLALASKDPLKRLRNE